MKTKTDILKLWKRTYDSWDKAIEGGKKTAEIQYSMMLTAYENILEMSRTAIMKKLKIK